VRSSATAEDLPTASFAGQQETYLNVVGLDALLSATVRCLSSLYTDRAIAYREAHGFAKAQVALSVGVQRMVRSDVGSAGVMFTLDTETGFPDVVLINAAYGLGELVVKGSVNPDEYLLFKPALEKGAPTPILRRHLGEKSHRMVLGDAPAPTRTEETPLADRARFALSDADAIQLAQWAQRIEAHYTQLNGRPTPMDIEWARDGLNGQLWIVQARPETVVSSGRESPTVDHLMEEGEVLVRGRAVGTRIARARRAVAAGAVPRGGHSRHRDDRPRLAPVAASSVGSRHGPRRAHLPRSDSQPRTRHSSRCGNW
jgi:pyruvate,water dikinase